MLRVKRIVGVEVLFELRDTVNYQRLHCETSLNYTELYLVYLSAAKSTIRVCNRVYSYINICIIIYAHP